MNNDTAIPNSRITVHRGPAVMKIEVVGHGGGARDGNIGFPVTECRYGEAIGFVVFLHSHLVGKDRGSGVDIGNSPPVIHNDVDAHVNAHNIQRLVFVLLHGAFVISRDTVRCQRHDVVDFDGLIPGYRRDNHSGPSVPP